MIWVNGPVHKDEVGLSIYFSRSFGFSAWMSVEHPLLACGCALCHTWRRVGLFLARPGSSPAFRDWALRRVRELFSEFLDASEGLIVGVGPPVAAGIPTPGISGGPVPPAAPVVGATGPETPLQQGAGQTVGTPVVGATGPETPLPQGAGQTVDPSLPTGPAEATSKAPPTTPPGEIGRTPGHEGSGVKETEAPAAKASPESGKKKKKKDKKKGKESAPPTAEKEKSPVPKSPVPDYSRSSEEESEPHVEETTASGKREKTKSLPSRPASKGSLAPETRERSPKSRSNRRAKKREERRDSRSGKRNRRSRSHRTRHRGLKERSRSRSRHTRPRGGHLPPPEPSVPPSSSWSLRPPPGRFYPPYWGGRQWNTGSKGVKRRERAEDIRVHGCDPQRKANREKYQQGR